MHEDDNYRASTQYRYWSYPQEALASLRQNTNELASQRVRAAIQRSRDSQNDLGRSKGQSSDEEAKEKEIQTLTVEEELKVVQWGCSKIIDMGQAMDPPIPMEIRATAIQFLRRFYLSNSPMTYHPQQIMKCALFLATKTDHWHIQLSSFISKLPKTTEDDIRAPEFLLMQGLRFTLDVRHPMRGLEGGIGEALAMAKYGELQGDGLDVDMRVGKAAEKANKLLRGPAQMTDVYFLYTPSQIWLAALLIADADLTNMYIAAKLRHLGAANGEAFQTKLSLTLKRCAEMLGSYKSADDDPAEKKEMKRIGRKLHMCQNPEKMDIVAVTKQKAAEKREGNESDRERVSKKRKVEKYRLGKDADVFGPDLNG